MNTGQIKELIEDTLNAMGVVIDDININEDSLGTVFAVTSAESRLLIGREGANLLAINHLIKKMVGNREEEFLPFTIDVNSYQENRNTEIKNRARIFAERVKSFSSNMEMDPMNSYERMIVHSALADDPEIKTESVGTGKSRYVVISLIEKN